VATVNALINPPAAHDSDYTCSTALCRRRPT
jgi:hypothetical protein